MLYQIGQLLSNVKKFFMPPNKMNTCKSETKKGTKCKKQASQSDYCIIHDPELRKEKEVTKMQSIPEEKMENQNLMEDNNNSQTKHQDKPFDSKYTDDLNTCMKCSNCGLEKPTETQKCDCGYQFNYPKESKFIKILNYKIINWPLRIICFIGSMVLIGIFIEECFGNKYDWVSFVASLFLYIIRNPFKRGLTIDAIILLIAGMCCFILFLSIVINNNFIRPAIQSPMKSSFEDCSEEEKSLLKNIIILTIKDEEMPTEEIHKKFWDILNNVSNRANIHVSPNEINQIKDLLGEVSSTYDKYFYEDALESLRIGRAYKSKKRNDYEMYLKTLGVSSDRFDKNQRLMEQIAQKLPITDPYTGEEVVFTEELINTIIENLENVAARINKLWDRDYYRK